MLARVSSSPATRSVCSRLLYQSAVRRAVTNMQMPAMSPTMTEGGIASWKKKEGESFVAGDVLLEIETDKATIDVEAQDDGVLGKILVQDGTKNVKIGKIIALLAEEGDDISNLQPPNENTSDAPKQEEPSSSSSSPHPQLSPEPSVPRSSEPISHSGPMFPSVYRLLAEHSIHDASKINGTGVRGMVTKGDVLAFLGKASGPLGTFKQSPSPIEEALKGLQKKEAPQVVPLDGTAIRKLIVSTMLQNSIKARTVPASVQVDFDSIIADYLPSPPVVKKAVPNPSSPAVSSSNFLDGLV
ncbi:single hybrid motif-containing protein [Rhodocollybia butyracea]|uniref:Single hybrid motif-containing protein n=1 Tax=Rhodocollybia butyracea TaxID=206335 RepID=A0A9P5PM23_9AGAR|nr:single hybrid motif-containing protein [Rhodocollybia butyracea]